MKVSIRLYSRVTSVNIRDSVAALYCMLMIDDEHLTKRRCEAMVNDAVYDIAKDWDGNNGKGFSSFVTDSLIKRILDGEDLKDFEKIHKLLGGKA